MSKNFWRIKDASKQVGIFVGGCILKKVLSAFVALSIGINLTGCSWDDPKSVANDGVFRIAMVPDMGGVNDQSFNQSALEGLYELRDEKGAQISYMESKQFSDFALNLDKLSDGPSDLIIGVGNALSDAVEEVSARNLDKNFAIVDFSFGENIANNVTGIVFRAQEGAFLVGYIAGMTTKTNKVGFVGGMKNVIIDQFQYGFEAGVLHAAKEKNVSIEVLSQYAESFSDAAKGKAIGSRMYSSGCDIIFHAAGGVGYGVIESAKELNKFVIGVDRDQSYLAPDNILTSAVKNVGTAVKLVSKELMDGKTIGGKNYEFGLKEGCVGIPKNHKNIEQAIYEKAMSLSKLVENGAITVPFDRETFESYKENF